MQLPSCRCVQIERRWNRCAVSGGSSVATVTRCPNSLMNSRPAVFIGPNGFMSMGTKLCVAGRSAYLVTFLDSLLMSWDGMVRRLYSMQSINP